MQTKMNTAMPNENDINNKKDLPPIRQDAGLPDPYSPDQENLTQEDLKKMGLKSNNLTNKAESALNLPTEVQEIPTQHVKNSTYQPPRQDVGIPDPASSIQEPLTPQELQSLYRKKPPIGETSIHLPNSLFNHTVILSIAALCSVFCLFIATQVLTIIEKVAQSPIWVQSIWYIAVCILVTVVILAIGRLVQMYIKLSQNPRIVFKGLKDLADLKKQMNISQTELLTARERLYSYVLTYPIDETPFHESDLVKLGFSETDFNALKNQKETLLNRSIAPSDQEWLTDFKGKFLAIIDRCVDARIRYYVFRVGIKTAVVPNSLIDTLIVIYSSLMLIGDICKIYNLRMDHLSLVIILGRSVIQSYIASETEELSKSLFEKTIEMTQDISQSISHGMVQKVGKIIVPKAIEGGVNGFLVWRLGKSAKMMLQPFEI